MPPQKQLRSQRCMDIIYHIIIISHPSCVFQKNRSHYFERIRLRQCAGCKPITCIRQIKYSIISSRCQSFQCPVLIRIAHLTTLIKIVHISTGTHQFTRCHFPGRLQPVPLTFVFQPSGLHPAVCIKMIPLSADLLPVGLHTRSIF